MTTSQEFEEYKTEFYKIYWDKILPILEKLEKKRPKELAKYIIVNSLVFILGIGIFIFNHYVAIFMAPVIIFTGLFLLVYMFKDYSNKLKKACMKNIMKAFNNIKWYNGYELIDCKELKDSCLFSPFDTVNSYDEFSGEHKGCKFDISELELKRIEGDFKNEDLYPKIFRGVVIRFPYNKQIEARTIVVSNNDKSVNWRDEIKNSSIFRITALIISALLALILVSSNLDVLYFRSMHIGWLIFFILTPLFYLLFSFVYRVVNVFIVKHVSFLNCPHDTTLKKINLEDVVFNKRFSAFSQDEVEGRFLLTPAFIERFTNLKTAFRAKKIKCSFYGDNLMIAMTTGNVFEVGNLFKKLDDQKNFEQFFTELTSVLYLIDYFKLSDSTGI